MRAHVSSRIIGCHGTFVKFLSVNLLPIFLACVIINYVYKTPPLNCYLVSFYSITIVNRRSYFQLHFGVCDELISIKIIHVILSMCLCWEPQSWSRARAHSTEENRGLVFHARSLYLLNFSFSILVWQLSEFNLVFLCFNNFLSYHLI